MQDYTSKYNLILIFLLNIKTYWVLYSFQFLEVLNKKQLALLVNIVVNSIKNIPYIVLNHKRIFIFFIPTSDNRDLQTLNYGDLFYKTSSFAMISKMYSTKMFLLQSLHPKQTLQEPQAQQFKITTKTILKNYQFHHQLHSCKLQVFMKELINLQNT